MHCSQARRLMTRREREAILGEEGQSLERHLAACLACRQEATALQRSNAVLRRAAPLLGPDTASEIVVDMDRALARFGTPRRNSAWGRPFLVAVGVGMAGLAACAVLHPFSPRDLAHVRGTGQPGPVSAQSTGSGPALPRLPAQRSIPQPETGSPHRFSATPALHPFRSVSARPVRLQAPAVKDAGVIPSLRDERYLDGRDPYLVSEWLTGRRGDDAALGWLEQRLAPMKDDFASIPLPQLASTDAKSRAVSDAVKKYDHEARSVDSRLFQKVTLKLKGASLDELCADLEKQTGVQLRASRAVQDEKVTVLLEERPAREVMRAVARLFGYLWARSGTEEAYKYNLEQDLRSQLAEQEMRNRDLNAALLAVDGAMGVYGPYTGKSVEQLRAELEKATGPERDRLSMLAYQGGWGALQLYQHLSPADITTLRDGGELKYGYSSWHKDRLPEEWKRPLLVASNMSIRVVDGQTLIGPEGTPAADYPGALPFLSLRIDRSELGQLTLRASSGVSVADGGGVGNELTLATGRSPSTLKPDNAAANKALRSQPVFRREVTLKPQPSCPQLTEDAKRKEKSQDDLADPLVDQPHVTSADVWEAVHRASGLPVVADFYSHLYPAAAAVVEKSPLFDALNREGDTVGARWKKDGEFLLCRGTSYFWDKLKEVPNTRLERWRATRKKEGFLPLEQMLEMAALPDAQLDSATVGRAIEHCWEIEEWGLFGKGSPRVGQSSEGARRYYRILALLNPDQLKRAQQPVGLPMSALNPVQQGEAVRLDSNVAGTVVHAAYAPSGWYVWEPHLPLKTDFHVYSRWPVVVGQTAEATLAAAREVDPNVQPQHIRRGRGTLAVWFLNGQGDLVAEAGKPMMFFEEGR